MPAAAKKTPAPRRIRRVKSDYDVLSSIRPEHVERGARRVSARDLTIVLTSSAEVTKRLNRAPFKKFRDDAEVGFRLLTEFAAGTWPRAPYTTIAILVFGFRYVLNADDLMARGERDDEVVMRLTFELVKRDLDAFRRAHKS